MDWNFNMDEAPRGEVRSVSRKIGKNDVTVEEHQPVSIVAAGNNGVVTITRWLPGPQRWEMFSAKVPPLAWCGPIPAHPQSEEDV